MTIRRLTVPFVMALLMLGACGPAEEVPDQREDPLDQSPDREDPGDVPETDPDTPDPASDPLYR